MADDVRLFLFAGASEPGDPIDPLTPLLGILSANARIIDARQIGDVSERTAARSFRPGVDAAVHDLTDVAASHGLRASSLRSAGAVLVSAERRHEPPPVSSAGRWRTPTPMDGLAPDGAVVVAMDAKPPRADRRVSRSIDAPASDKRHGVVFAGEIAALYAALIAIHRGVWTGPVTLIAKDSPAFAATENYVDLLGLKGLVTCRLAKSRKERALIASQAERVFDLNPLAWPGLTDVMIAGRAAGAPAARIEGALDDLPVLIADALREKEADRHINVPPEQTAHDLLAAAIAASRRFAARRKGS